MSLHRSLVIKDKLKRKRNVLTRAERVEQMLEAGDWQQGETVFGLPKTKVAHLKHRKKKKKAETSETAEGSE